MKTTMTAASLKALQTGTIPVIQWDFSDMTHSPLDVEQVEAGLQFDGSCNLACTICIGNAKATHYRRFIFSGIVNEAEVQSLAFSYEPEWDWNEHEQRSQAEFDVLDYLATHHSDLLMPGLNHLSDSQKKDLAFLVIFDSIQES